MKFMYGPFSNVINVDDSTQSYECSLKAVIS